MQSNSASSPDEGARALPNQLLRFVADAGRDLLAQFDYGAAILAAVRGPVPQLADLAILYLDEPERAGPRIDLAHRDPALERAACTALEQHQSELLRVARDVALQTRARRPQWLPRLDDETLRRIGGPNTGLSGLRDELGIGSVLVFPMYSNDRIHGAYALARLADQPPLAAAELAAGSLLAQRASLAIENGRLRRAADEESLRRVREERTLRQWGHVFEYAEWGVAVLRADGSIDAANPALARMHGTGSAAALVGRSFVDLAVPDERASVSSRLAAGQGAVNYQTTHLRTDGTGLPVLVSVTTMAEDEGSPGYRIANVQDLSDVRRTEERLYRAQRMEAVGRLAGGVAHEINNMMTIILGFTDFLRDTVSPSDRPDVEEVRKAAIRAAGITQQLLAYGRQQLLNSAVLDLDGVVTEMAGVLRPLLPASVALETRLVGHGRVRADRAQLEQVIINLAFNARDAMPRGGTLTLGAEFRELDADYATSRVGVPVAPGRYALLSVADDGSGMSAETQACLFEPFFTTKPVGQGTGLGLATVYGIVKQSDGFIWVDSEIGRGTTFTVCLPQVDVAPDDAVESAETEAVEGGRETILLVEDDESVRMLTLRALREAGYRVVDARNGREALELVRPGSLEFDAVVTDIVMPGMGGTDLREELRRTHPHVPVLYISASQFDDARQKGLVGPGDPFLQKPFTPHGLMRAVRVLLDAGLTPG